MVTWQRPTKSNGQIIKYRIMWFGSRKKPKMKMLNGETYSYTMSNVKRDSKFVVRLIAENSAGQSPLGRCIVDTTKIPTGRFGYGLLPLAYVTRSQNNLAVRHFKYEKLIDNIYIFSSSEGQWWAEHG